jgi:fatty acid desaturase
VYERARAYHVIWFTVTLALYAGSIAILLSDPSIGLRALAIVGAALAMMQLGLFAHEVGHGAVTRSGRGREALGQLAHSFLIGFGFSHWQATHPVHHNHPNTEGVDPDIESHGYALHERAARRMHTLAARGQPVTLLLGFLLWGFGIRVASVHHAIRHFGRRTAVDLVCVAGHFGAWIGLGLAFGSLPQIAIDYAVITVLNGIYMGAILVVPHVGTGSCRADEELPFFERQVAFSRNYDASWIGTLLCGGLNLQIEHHLLPAVPCTRLRRAGPIVRAYCERHGLPYRQVGYWTAWREVLRHGRRMAQIARASGAPAARRGMAPAASCEQGGAA